MAGRHVDGVIEGDAAPVVPHGVLGDVIGDQRLVDAGSLEGAQPHHRDAGERRLRHRVRRQPHLVAVRILAASRRAVAHVVGAVDQDSPGRDVLLRRDVLEEVGELHAGARESPRAARVTGRVGSRFDISSRVLAAQRLGVRDVPPRVLGAELAPHVVLEVEAALLRDLEPDVRHPAVVVEERHQSVVGAVLAALDQRERERRPRPAAIALLAPGAARSHDVVPVRAPAVGEPLGDRDQVAAGLHQLDRHRRQVLALVVGVAGLVAVVAQLAKRAGPWSGVVERERSLEVVARHRALLGQGEGGVVDRARRRRTGGQLLEGEELALHVARPLERVAGDRDRRRGWSERAQEQGADASNENDLPHAAPSAGPSTTLRRFGSSASRRPSPARFKARTVIAMAAPGNVAVHQ